jgi:ribosomal protein S18 acetylase RimI-like enzyme
MHIREATLDDVHGIARVHIDTWRTTYVDIVPTEYLAGLSYEQRESRWRENLSSQGDGNFTLVADADGSVVGFAGGGPERNSIPGYDGELYGLYVLAAYQRQGIGRELTLTVARRLAADGFKAMILWVLKDNLKACAFYETVGGMPVGEKTITIGGAELIEVAYGWPDIRSLNQGGERSM